MRLDGANVDLAIGCGQKHSDIGEPGLWRTNNLIVPHVGRDDSMQHCCLDFLTGHIDHDSAMGLLRHTQTEQRTNRASEPAKYLGLTAGRV